MNQISPSELKKRMETDKEFLLVDIREDWERELYNIGGMHIPIGELITHINELPKDKDIVLYCEKGIRSVIAIQRLESIGYNHLFNLSGGMKAWKESSK